MKYWLICISQDKISFCSVHLCYQFMGVISTTDQAPPLT